LLDIWKNVLLDIRENVEWPHFFWPTLYTLARGRNVTEKLYSFWRYGSCETSAVNINCQRRSTGGRHCKLTAAGGS